MMNVSNEEYIRLKEIWNALSEHIDEKTKRLLSAAIAKSFGHGGVGISHSVTKTSKSTIIFGINQLNGTAPMEADRQRISGGGRKKITEIYPDIKDELEKLVEPETKGDPESPLLWTCKSTNKLAEQMSNKGYEVSAVTVAELLREMDYRLQANKKTIEGENLQDPDRNKQFEYINLKVKEFQEQNQPVISVDAKKKENIGNYKNNGKEYAPKGTPIEVNVYDFADEKKGKAIPYGVYDIAENTGWVNVGIDSNTAEFAVESIRRWWNNMGCTVYSDAKQLLINADGGGSNSSRGRLWKTELQNFCNEIEIPITVCHFPPGTSKWNKIEHQLFSQISINWRGRPLTTHEVIVNLISNTRTRKGLKVNAVLDTNKYETGIKISDEEMQNINLKRHESLAKWNYTIFPQIQE